MGRTYNTHVRVGGPQAGHSIKLPSGDILKLQTIPVGAALGAEAIIGMQSVIDPEVLYREIGWFNHLGLRFNLIIDSRATILELHDVEMEAKREMAARIGSTGKGVGAARANRILRRAQTAGDFWGHDTPGGVVISPDTSQMIAHRLQNPRHGVLVEAAQGIALSLFSSGYYPYCTSCEATPTGAFAELGLPLRYAQHFESVGVFRTFPIRVAGNSGPLPFEISWDILESERGASIPDSEKMTTVTNKVRRIARWDPKAARAAVERTGLDWAALTFLDYPYPEVAGQTDYDRFPPNVKRYVTAREKDLGIPIHVVGTGFGTYAWRI
jgi:adenylosuccinate synthase